MPPAGAGGAPALPDDDPLLDRTEPTDGKGFARAIAIRHAQYAARLLAEALLETAQRDAARPVAARHAPLASCAQER